jgi:hypothetical protein
MPGPAGIYKLDTTIFVNSLLGGSTSFDVSDFAEGPRTWSKVTAEDQSTAYD